MTFVVGRIVVPTPIILPLATAIFFIVSIGCAVLTRRPELPSVNVSFIGNR